MLFIVGPFLVVGWISADKAAESMQDEVGRTMLQLTKQNHATIEKTMSAVNDKTITFLDNHLLDPTGPNEFWYNIETLGDINQADEILNRWSSDGTGYTLYMMNREEKRTLFDLSNKDTGFIYFDRGEKALAYARAGIRQYLVVNLVNDSIEDYREPDADGFQMKNTYRGDDTFSLLSFPDIEIRTSDLLGE